MVFPRKRQPGSSYGQIYHYLDIAINFAQTTTGQSFEQNSCLCPQSVDQFCSHPPRRRIVSPRRYTARLCQFDRLNFRCLNP